MMTYQGLVESFLEKVDARCKGTGSSLLLGCRVLEGVGSVLNVVQAAGSFIRSSLCVKQSLLRRC